MLQHEYRGGYAPRRREMWGCGMDSEGRGCMGEGLGWELLFEEYDAVEGGGSRAGEAG